MEPLINGISDLFRIEVLELFLLVVAIGLLTYLMAWLIIKSVVFLSGL